MRPHLVGAERVRLLSVCRVEVGIGGTHVVAAGKLAIVRAAGGALPLRLEAQSRAGYPAAPREPLRIGARVPEGNPRHRQPEPVLLGALLAREAQLVALVQHLHAGTVLDGELPGFARLLQIELAGQRRSADVRSPALLLLGGKRIEVIEVFRPGRLATRNRE